MKNIIAHRGIHDNILIPENSMKAFEMALQKNIGIELDIRISKDNKLVVFHDDNLKRMTKKDVFIEDLNYQEIINTKLLDSNQNIPSFESVLKLVDSKVLLDIEIKDTKNYNILIINLIKLLDNYDNFIIKSFNPKIIKRINKLRPNYTCGLLLKKDTNKFINKLIIWKYKPDFLAIQKELLKHKNIKKYSSKHDLYIWTIKNKNEILSINSDSYNYICNNLIDTKTRNL